METTLQHPHSGIPAETGGAGPAFAPLNPVAAALARRIAREKSRAVSAPMLSGVYRALEAATMAGTGACAYYAYVDEPGFESVYLVLSALVALTAALVFDAFRLYSTPALAGYARNASRLAAIWTALLAALTVAAFFIKVGHEFSRGWLAIWFVSALVLLLLERGIMAALVSRLTRSGQLLRRAVVVGGGDAAANLIAAIDSAPDSGIRICGLFDDRADDRSPLQVLGRRKLGTVAELASFARAAEIDLLIVTLPATAESRLLEIVRRISILPVDVRLSAHSSRLRFRPRAYSYMGPVPFLDLLDKPLDDWGRLLKATEDRLLASLALLLALPAMALVALAIRLESPGPVLFRQRRYGFNNELIQVLKFRSMYVDQCDADAKKLVTKNDPRVTRVGRFIRKTSLDELPQLFNVLRGELSMVGPRPHATSARAGSRLYDEVVDGYFTRHRVKPGITGWSQVNGWRGETDTEEKIVRRVEHDLYYIENWSVLFDLYILAITPLSLLNTDQAY